MEKTILLRSRPQGIPVMENFLLKDEQLGQVSEGEILVSAKYFSVDPYLRGRMTNAQSYIPPFELNAPIVSGAIVEVLESKNEEYQVGDFLSGLLPWKSKQVISPKGLNKVDPSKAPLSAYLGILGMTGLTAYTGLMEIGAPKSRETLLVSGAAGAVGSVVGQIGKILGMHVVGIAGSDEKVKMLTDRYGMDAGINYKTTSSMSNAIAEHCPDGVDIYFDNVGGDIADAALLNINTFARIINCGVISIYNSTTLPVGMSVRPILIKKSALMQGFIVSNYQNKFPEAIQKLSQWLSEGKLVYDESVMEGFTSLPEAFIGLFEGRNKGKMLVKV